MIHSFNSDFFCIFALYMRRGVLFDYFFLILLSLLQYFLIYSMLWVTTRWRQMTAKHCAYFPRWEMPCRAWMAPVSHDGKSVSTWWYFKTKCCRHCCHFAVTHNLLFFNEYCTVTANCKKNVKFIHSNLKIEEQVADGYSMQSHLQSIPSLNWGSADADNLPNGMVPISECPRRLRPLVSQYLLWTCSQRRQEWCYNSLCFCHYRMSE